MALELMYTDLMGQLQPKSSVISGTYVAKFTDDHKRSKEIFHQPPRATYTKSLQLYFECSYSEQASDTKDWVRQGRGVYRGLLQAVYFPCRTLDGLIRT